MIKDLEKNGIECTLILDASVGYIMESIDLVMVGAEGVVESGGIINRIGTFTMAICAREMKKPFYVLTESFKFSRLYPLNQRDLPNEYKVCFNFTLYFMQNSKNIRIYFLCNFAINFEIYISELNYLTKNLIFISQYPKDSSKTGNFSKVHPLVDYTPPLHITLLFTDLGILTPSAISDELIKLYL